MTEGDVRNTRAVSRLKPAGLLRHQLLLALLAGRVFVVLGAGHGDLGRVALLLQQLVEGVQLVTLVQGREISRLQYVTMGNSSVTTTTNDL